MKKTLLSLFAVLLCLLSSLPLSAAEGVPRPGIPLKEHLAEVRLSATVRQYEKAVGMLAETDFQRRLLGEEDDRDEADQKQHQFLEKRIRILQGIVDQLAETIDQQDAQLQEMRSAAKAAEAKAEH